MKIFNLGKILKKSSDTPTKKLKDQQLILNENGSLITIACADPMDSWALAKSMCEELYLQEDDVYIIDNHGALASIGLIFDPSNSDEIALSIPYDDGEFPELKALEYAAKLMESLDQHSSMDQFNHFRNKLTFFLLFEGFKGHRAIFNTPFTLDFLKSKDLAMEYFEFLSYFLNETSNTAITKKDLNLIKYLVGIILKRDIELKSLNDLFELLDSFKSLSEKLNVSDGEIERFVEKVKSRFTKYREFFFSGINFSDELLASLAVSHNISSFYISSQFDKHYKELESFILLKKLLNLSISNYNKEMAIILDLVEMPELLDKFIENFELLKNYKNINWIVTVDKDQNKILEKLITMSTAFFHKGLNGVGDLPFIKGEDVYGERTSEDIIFAKRPEFSISKKITSADIPKMSIAEEFYTILGLSEMASTGKIFKLIVQSGPLKGKEILVTGDELVFGRNEFCPSNKLVSRKHMKFVFDGDNYFILDTSVNGTFLNGQKIKKSVLSNGDRIILGNNEVEIMFNKQ